VQKKYPHYSGVNIKIKNSLEHMSIPVNSIVFKKSHGIQALYSTIKLQYHSIFFRSLLFNFVVLAEAVPRPNPHSLLARLLHQSVPYATPRRYHLYQAFHQ